MRGDELYQIASLVGLVLLLVTGIWAAAMSRRRDEDIKLLLVAIVAQRTKSDPPPRPAPKEPKPRRAIGFLRVDVHKPDVGREDAGDCGPTRG